MRKRAFYWRYDTPAELMLLNQMWPLVSFRLNFFTPTRNPIAYTTAADGRRRWAYDDPKTPCERVPAVAILTENRIAAAQARVHGVNPDDLTRRIDQIQIQIQIQTQLTASARARAEALGAATPFDLEVL
ncbi:MAG: hypothetical protein AB7V43_14760 [Acidimicrobiia bacterium]